MAGVGRGAQKIQRNKLFLRKNVTLRHIGYEGSVCASGGVERNNEGEKSVCV